MPKKKSTEITPEEGRSFYILSFSADFSGFSMDYRFVYREISHILEAADWFFTCDKCPFRTLFNELSLHAEFQANLWAVEEGEVGEPLEIREFVTAFLGQADPRPLLECSDWADTLDPEELRGLQLELDADLFATMAPLIDGDLMTPGYLAALAPSKELDKETVALLGRAVDREGPFKWPKKGVVTYGPVDLESGLRIDGFDDPDPAPPGSPAIPPSEDELRERFIEALEEEELGDAAKVLTKLEKGLSYPLYTFRAELASRKGAHEQAVANALLQLTPAPTDVQLELVERMLSIWSSQPEPNAETLFEHVEKELSQLEPEELFDVPATIAAALRSAFGEDSLFASRINLIDALSVVDDPEQLSNLLDQEAKDEAEAPVVAAGLFLLGSALGKWGQPEGSLIAIRRSLETYMLPRAALWYGLRMMQLGDPEAIEYVRQAVPVLNEPEQWQSVEQIIDRYARPMDIELQPVQELLSLAFDELERAGADDLAVIVAERLTEEGHWLGEYRLGCLLQRQERHEEAIAAFRRGLGDWIERAKRREGHDFKKYRADATFRLACAEAALGRNEVALETLQRACRLDETNQRRARESKVFEPLWKTVEFMRVAGGAGAVKQETIEVETRVVHKKFGEGVVTEVAGQGEKAKLTIEFDSGETKKLLAKFVRAL